jgi:hypothetical protein
VHEFCSDGAIHTPADSPDNSSSGSTKFADSSDFFSDKFFLPLRSAMDLTGGNKTDHGPVSSTFADVQDESPDHLFSSGRVSDFWVELDSVERFRVMCDSSIWCGAGLSNDVEICGNLG